jgi:hypothetical protein
LGKIEYALAIIEDSEIPVVPFNINMHVSVSKSVLPLKTNSTEKGRQALERSPVTG